MAEFRAMEINDITVVVTGHPRVMQAGVRCQVSL